MLRLHTLLLSLPHARLATSVPASVAGPAPASRNPPNLLLLFPDQWRWDFNELTMGEPLIRTPTFASVARRGSLFERAYVPSPLCAPSRAALALGREYDHQQVPSNSFDVPPGVSTFYRALRDDAKYHVMVAGKDDLTKHSGYCGTTGHNNDGLCLNASYRAVELGYSAWQARTPGKLGTLTPNAGPYNAFLAESNVTLPNGTQANAQWVHDVCFGETGLQPGQKLPRSNWTCCHGAQVCDVPVHLPAEYYEDNWVGQKGLEMLLQRPPGQPWYMQVNWPGPHTPFIVTKEMMDSTATRAFQPPVDYFHGPNSVDDNIVARRLYAAEVENLDGWFAQYIHATQQLGDYDNTIICISSDHGEMLGDHGDWDKSKPWEGSAHVPLVCSGPGIRVQTVPQPVTTMDLAATWLEFAGLTGMAQSTSRSLVPVLRGDVPQNREFISSGLGQNASGFPENQTWDWRMVVKRAVFSSKPDAEPQSLKYICCHSTCPGAPSSVPLVQAHQWQELLYDVETDWREMHPLNLSDPHYKNISEHLRQRLPPIYAEGCRNAIPPPAPVDTQTFQLTWSSPGKPEKLYVAATANTYHAQVALAGSKTVSRELSTFRVSQSGMVELTKPSRSPKPDPGPENASTTTLTLMLKHGNDPNPCASGKSAEILLGPLGTWSLSLETGVEASRVMLTPTHCKSVDPPVCIVPFVRPLGVELALGPCGDGAIFTRVDGGTSTV